MIGVPLAVIQSVAFIYILRQSVLAGSTAGTVTTSPMEWVVAVLAMTAGSVLLMWIGELITEQGVGNGISLIIFAGIVSQLPKTIRAPPPVLLEHTSAGKLNVFGWFELPVNQPLLGSASHTDAWFSDPIYTLVKINEAQRIITVNYAKRVGGNTSYGGIRSILPVKLIAAGVIPVIFAVAFLSLPAFVGQVMKAMPNADQALLLQTSLNGSKHQQQPVSRTVTEVAVYPIAYFLLVIAFTYFYTGIVFNSGEIAENLQKQGGFIEGVRPGVQTEKYLSRTVNRLILFGSIALGIIAVMPLSSTTYSPNWG